MSQTLVSVEWLFNEIETYFRFVSYTNICLFSNSPQPKFREMPKKLFFFFFKKNETSDILKISCTFFYEVPTSWQFSEKIFTEAATGGVL